MMKKFLNLAIVLLLIITIGIVPVPVHAQTSDEQDELENFLNNNSWFLTSIYTKPEEMDLFELFYSGAGINDANISQEEKTSLENLYNNGETINVGITKVKKQNAINLLKEKTDLTEDKIVQMLNETQYLYYLADYDAYYTIHGDTNISDVQVLSYTIENNNIYKVMYSGGYFVEINGYNCGCVTLEKNGDSYMFVANEALNNKEVDKIYTNWKEAYIDKLSGYEKDAQYTLADIDNNGIPELIVKTGTYEADYELYFYTFKDNLILELGNLAGGHTALYEMNNKDYIQLIYAHMNEEAIYNIGIQNDVLTKTLVSKRDVDDAEDYTTGDIDLEFYNLNDYSLINNYQVNNEQNNAEKNNIGVGANKTPNDNTVANKNLPKTGETSNVIIIAIGVVILGIIVTIIAMKKYKKI